MGAYARAMVATRSLAPTEDAHTFAALTSRYFASPNFLKLAPSSQYCTRKVMERFITEHGHRLVAEMTREHVDIIIGRKADTPAAANTWLKRLRTLIRYSIALRWRADDPTAGVSKFKEGEYHTWDEAELAAFEARWPLGTRERTAYALALCTGQRRADVCRMTWADITDGRMKVVQAKTKTKLVLPIPAELKVALAAWPRSHMTIIVSTRGAQYTVESFGNLMADAINAAGLPARCVLHGLRKAAARRLAEAGCSASQIAAVTGHKTLSEVERYTKAASQSQMADDAIIKLAAHRVGIRDGKARKT
jgi:integrase